MNHAAFRASSASGCIGRNILLGATLGALLFLASCTNQSPTGPHATVLMRDGTTLTGTVTATSPTEITLVGDDKANHTVPMTQVKSIEYDDAAATQASAPPTAPTLARRSSARAASDRVHENHYHPTRTEITTKTYVLPAGTKVSVRNEDTINSDTAVEGQTYAAEVTDDVLDANGDVVIPHGSSAQIVIRSASKGGRFRGTSDLVLDLQSISVEGQQYNVSTTDVKESGRQGFGANKRTAEFTGGGAAIGAIIGAIAGRGKGAAIGAGAGAGAGALTQVATKGGSIKVPSETVLTFQLDKPVQIVEAK
jgi:YMGG-like Gly-zipper